MSLISRNCSAIMVVGQIHFAATINGLEMGPIRFSLQLYLALLSSPIGEKKAQLFNFCLFRL